MTTGSRVLPAAGASRRPSNATGVSNTDLAEQLGTDAPGARAVAAAARQVVDDTGADAPWLVCGAPPEPRSTLEMRPGTLADLDPDGPAALPPELA